MKVNTEMKDLVTRKFKELQDYTVLFNKKSENDRLEISKNKELFKKDPESIDMDSLGMNLLYINGFHQLDIRKLQTDFVALMSACKDIDPDFNFSEEMETTYTVLKQGLPKPTFVVDSGAFKEVELGKVNELMNSYKTKSLFKLFSSQLETLLSSDE